MKECVVKLNYALIFNFYNKILTAVDIFRSDIKSCFMNNDTNPPPGLWGSPYIHCGPGLVNIPWKVKLRAGARC